MDEYVWTPFYVDQLVERDETVTEEAGASGHPHGGAHPDNVTSTTTRLYAEQDSDYNVTSLTDSSGTVVERYQYDPYGNVTVLNADGTVKGDGTAASSDYGWVYLHQGLRLDATAGLYDDRNRIYDPALGRFLQQDEQQYVDGPSRYEYEGDNLLNSVDPTGNDTGVIVVYPRVNTGGLSQVENAHGSHTALKVGNHVIDFGKYKNDNMCYQPNGNPTNWRVMTWSEFQSKMSKNDDIKLFPVSGVSDQDALKAALGVMRQRANDDYNLNNNNCASQVGRALDANFGGAHYESLLANLAQVYPDSLNGVWVVSGTPIVVLPGKGTQTGNSSSSK